jgi:hypothetical protein
MLAFAAVGLAVAPLAGKLTATVDPRFILTLSLALAAVGTLSMTGVNAGSSWTATLPGLVLAGTGLGLIGPTLASSTRARQAPQSTGTAWPRGGPNGLPPITSAITIDGNGSTIERSPATGTPLFRLFYVAADPTNPNTFNYIVPAGSSSGGGSAHAPGPDAQRRPDEGRRLERRWRRWGLRRCDLQPRDGPHPGLDAD